MDKQKFTCQQCGLKVELETVFNYEVCPKCNGNLFPDDYVEPPNEASETQSIFTEDYMEIQRLQLENTELKKVTATLFFIEVTDPNSPDGYALNAIKALVAKITDEEVEQRR
jgi:hypothetical protein